MSVKPLPAAFVARMQDQMGREFEELALALDKTVPVSIRTNPTKWQERQLAGTTRKIAWHPDGCYLAERPSFVADPMFHAGAYYVQEASSMMLYQFIDFGEDLRILDLCGAPGGKSTLLAGAMSEGSLLVSNEVIASRAKVLAENMTRWGNPRVWVTQNDPIDFQRLPNFFDLIVIDAPCSGEGMFRKDVQVRDTWTENSPEVCAARQKRILSDVLNTLKPGGQIIYSTCTFAKAENEDIVEWLLHDFEDEVELDPLEGLEGFGAVSVNINGVAKAAYRCYPHKLEGEGMFFCRMKRKGDWIEETISSGKKKKKKGRQNEKPKSNPLVEGFVKDYTRPWHGMKSMVREDKLFMVMDEGAKMREARLKVLAGDMLIGKIHRDNINPTHELAMSHLVSDSIPSVELNYDEAIQYLQKQDISKDTPHKKGWVLARYQGVSLGWIKVVNNRLKNHYPTNWRIRKQL